MKRKGMRKTDHVRNTIGKDRRVKAVTKHLTLTLDKIHPIG